MLFHELVLCLGLKMMDTDFITCDNLEQEGFPVSFIMCQQV